MQAKHRFGPLPSFLARAGAALSFASAVTLAGPVNAAEAPPGQAGAPYENMPLLAPIGVRVDRYFPVPATELAQPIDPAKGYRLERLGRGLYMITDNTYQSMFMVYETGVVVVDAPPSYSAHIRQAIAEVTKQPITHVIYSHSHADHIGGVTDLGGHSIIIAQEETKRLLARDNDPKRPLPTVVFKTRYRLKLGSQVLALSYHGDGHEPGNIFIYAPEQRTLMVVDLVFPGWMPWRRFAVAHDVPGYFRQVAEIDKVPFKTLVGGHLTRTGNHADVRTQLEFMDDLKTATAAAQRDTAFGVGMSPDDSLNSWALSENFIARVVIRCVNAVTPKWQNRLAAFDVYIWDQCYAMEESLRID